MFWAEWTHSRPCTEAWLLSAGVAVLAAHHIQAIIGNNNKQAFKHAQRESGRFAFFEPPLGGLGATYDDHLKLIGKRVVDFLLVLIELLSLDATAEALRVNIGLKSAISLQRSRLTKNFR